MCSGEARPIADPSKPVTFRALGERWTSGELARLYPDHVTHKERADIDRQQLERYVYPLLEHVTIAGFSLDDAERVMRALPHEEAGTRRHYALLVHRVLSLAVFPLRLRPDNPLPRGFLPKKPADKAKAHLYPDEDRRLLECFDVPFCWRLFYGFLDREGCRSWSEAAAFTLSDVDLDRGVIKLDENKTDDPRAWALDPGVVRALRASIARREAAAGAPLPPDALLFVDDEGRPMDSGDHRAERFRAYLKRAGIDRAELFERSSSRLPIRVHDLRATFITHNLANGKTETWIADRTGHKSSDEIHGYRRQARMAAELGLGELTPLDLALPELAPPPSVPPGGPSSGGGPESAQRGAGSGPAALNGSEPEAPGGGNPAGSRGTLPLDADAASRGEGAGG